MVYINDNIECLKQVIEQCDECDEQYQHISRLYDMVIKKYSGTAHKTEVWTFWIQAGTIRGNWRYGVGTSLGQDVYDIYVTERQAFLINGADISSSE